MPLFPSYVAIGDSFTEGVGDERADGTVRGWADLVATALALASPKVQAQLAGNSPRKVIVVPDRLVNIVA